MPHQRVTLYFHAVCLGEHHDAIAVGVIEPILGRLGGVPLHLVLGRDIVELGAGDVRVHRLAEMTGAERGADELAARPKGRSIDQRRRSTPESAVVTGVPPAPALEPPAPALAEEPPAAGLPPA